MVRVREVAHELIVGMQFQFWQAYVQIFDTAEISVAELGYLRPS